MPTKDSELNRIYDKLEVMQKMMSDGFTKIEKDIEKLERQGNEQSNKTIKIETRFDAHTAEYREFKTENDKIHTTLFDKCRELNNKTLPELIDKTIPELIDAKNNAQLLKIIGAVFGVVTFLVGAGIIGLKVII